MRKLLLICSAISLIYGNCVWGMDYDESELYENPWRDPNLDPLKENFDKNDEKQSEETLSKNSVYEHNLKKVLNFEREKVKKHEQDLKKVLNLQRETIKSYEKALQKSQQLLAEEREKNKQLKTQEQRVKTAELDQLSNDFNSELNLHNTDSELKPQQTNDSKTKGFKFKNFNTEHPEKLFNIGAQPTSNLKVRTKTLEPKKMDINLSEYKQNFVFLGGKRKQIQEQLFEAVKKGLLPDMQAAIKNGANVNDQDKDGYSPLHWAVKSYVAAQNGHLEIVKYLVEHGADINKAAVGGRTPLYIAAQNGHLEVIKYLKEQGADINKVTVNGWTPLYVAAQNGHLEIVKYLVEQGNDINKATVDGWTPLYVAAQNGHLEVIKYLKEQGADINKAIVKGVTPLYIAAQNGHLEIIKYLKEQGADINKAIVDGVTPLYIAAQNGHLKIIKYLVEHGADVNKNLNNGDTPLSIAKSKLQISTLTEQQKQKYQEIVSYLISKGAYI